MQSNDGSLPNFGRREQVPEGLRARPLYAIPEQEVSPRVDDMYEINTVNSQPSVENYVQEEVQNRPHAQTLQDLQNMQAIRDSQGVYQIKTVEEAHVETSVEQFWQQNSRQNQQMETVQDAQGAYQIRTVEEPVAQKPQNAKPQNVQNVVDAFEIEQQSSKESFELRLENQLGRSNQINANLEAARRTLAPGIQMQDGSIVGGPGLKFSPRKQMQTVVDDQGLFQIKTLEEREEISQAPAQMSPRKPMEAVIDPNGMYQIQTMSPVDRKSVV